MGQYLPEDIVIAEVLHKLPVKSLVRFRCVSKTWHQVIDSSSFIKTHLTYQKDSDNKYVLYESTPLCLLLTNRDSILDLPKISKRYITPDISLACTSAVNINYMSRGGLRRVYGICNGLLCLSYKCYRIGDDILLWNPSCYKIKKLPQINISLDISLLFTRNASVSFGYYNEDYKVIVIVPDPYFVFVYSLSTNNWKFFCCSEYYNLHDHIPPHDNAAINYTGFVDATAYMITVKVACFDLSDETFQVINLPKELFTGYGSILTSFTVEAYGESLAIFACDYSNYPGSFNMWILKHRSSSSSTSPWEKKFVFVLQNRRLSGVGFLNNDKYVARTTKDEQGMIKFFVCNLQSQKLLELGSLHADNYSVHEIYGRIHSNYVESLLLLNEDGLKSPSLDILKLISYYARLNLDFQIE